MLHVSLTEKCRNGNHKFLNVMLAGFALLLLMLFALLFIGISNMDNNSILIADIINYHYVANSIAEDMRFSSRNESVAIRNIIMNPENKDSELQRYNKAIEAYDNSKNQLMKTIQNRKDLNDRDLNNLEKKLFDDINEDEKTIHMLWDKAIKLGEHGNMKDVSNFLTTEVRVVQWRWLDNLNRIVDLERKHSSESYEEFVINHNRSKKLTIIFGLAAMIIGLTMAIASTIHTSRLVDKLIIYRTADAEARQEEMKKSYEVESVLTKILKLSYKDIDIKEFLNLTLDTLFSLPWFAAKSVGCVFLYDETAGVLRMAARKNFPAQLVEPCKEIQVGKCLCGLAASRKELVYKNCVDSEHEITFENIPEHGHYCVPIMMKDRVLGVINVDVDAGHKRDMFEEKLLLMFADVLASIIDRKKVDEKLEHLANYDALTGVPNRALLFDRLAQSINNSKRYNDKTAVIYIDLDKFKPINDNHGHDAGDVVLKKTTNRLKRCVR
ncbi:MAG: diguanylate cyclase, partial [Nitrospirae bacterium]|nr:diguanylate cyclase [Nitrospirota bacterium]